MLGSFDIVVFSHLRWDFVLQRPQHLLSRFGARHRVIFIEEPVLNVDRAPFWEIRETSHNVFVCKPHTPTAGNGYTDDQFPILRELIAQLFEQQKINDYVIWFYTPMALPLADSLAPRAVVYDCMDELSAFFNAPRELIERENRLLKLADVVFTGGPSLYRAKKNRHPNVHCFPSSVDAAHFATASSAAAPADQAHLPAPRIGYYGVIDERIDLELLGSLAAARPEWQIIMVGPVVKIDPAALPKRDNLHYLGSKSYAQLPAYMGGWDVCMMPFARNDSTRFISPTKTLEFMAAGKMIVSTPITDVAEPYGKLVYLASGPQAFAAACEQAMNASQKERESRVAGMREVLGKTSWDATARKMEGLMEQAILKNRNLEDGIFVPAAARMNTPKASPKTVVIGAGPTGLSAAYHLGEDAVLLEQHSRVGGWCRSIEDKGFTFDYAGHIMFSNDPYVHEMYAMLLGDNVHWQDREAWIYSKNVYTRYPFQGALYGLPPEVIKECITGAIEARFGSLGNKKPAAVAAPVKTNGHRPSSSASDCKAESITDCCGDGVLESSAPLGVNTVSGAASSEPRNFEEFIYKVWGSGIARHFAIPYNKKLWAVPLTEMETSWLGGRVPMPDLEELIDGALTPKGKPMGPNARFGYPLKGGFQALMSGFLPHLKGELKLNTKVRRISAANHTVALDDGSEIKYESLVSTMPLPTLVRSLGDEAPVEIRQAAAKLRHVSVRCVNIGVARENLTEKHWIYYPEDSIFHRIFVQGNASPHCNPKGGFGLTCEITYSEYKPLPCDGEELIQRCIDDCIKVGFFNADDKILTANQVDMPYAYVVYDHGRAKSVAQIRDWLAQHDILLAGRYSEWEYYNSDHAFLAGKNAAEKVQELHARKAAAKHPAVEPWMSNINAQGD
ncbi:MAG TPA: UDP-galactopyranose mutase [Solibacterales bacterium]|nr:UDP-galactopyranose mutase [Bryobacterales bacterium]